MYRLSATYCVLTTVAADFNGCETTSAIQNSESRQLDEKYAQLQSMEQIVDSFSGIKWSDDPAQRQANAKVLDQFLTTIEAHMETFLLKEHDEDQVEWDSSKRSAEGCYDTHWEVVRVQERKWDVNKWIPPTEHTGANWPLDFLKTKFETCMAAHYAWENYANKAKTCQESPTFGSRVGHHTTMCEWMECAKSEYETYKQTQPHDDTEPGAHCEEQQLRFEGSFCKLRDDLTKSCETRTNCLAGEDFSAIRAKLQGRSENRAALWKTMQILKCRVKHLLGDENYKNGSFDKENETHASDFEKPHQCDAVGQFVKFLYSNTSGPTDCYNDPVNTGNPGTAAVPPETQCILNLAPPPAPGPPECPAADENKILCNCPVCLHPGGCDVSALPIHIENEEKEIWQEEPCQNFISWQYGHFADNVSTACGNINLVDGIKEVTRCRVIDACDA